ncbi:MAG TPA: YcaO-related McrA-glycine thioamidation protein [Candidatus Methanoculleus thermohydrogenotrophicum]|nr:YcaO-related McrA-glycine thioamidation protein [Candidatus Methanoculleus thermohydrogenotrophicum]NLM82592.1 YcaO-related McrA-glycine thioamidation protein [Candidatus Methanoculleus thermohydrogenotrophicum]HOB18089.1 YcaO-related McrA-glycine thioamidation protein [Candidatus Methanoculleus thermohydrogenotrophicum]HPZ37805.1 YcaO-related McrA-glycine thioamidation protein [Candidatus Methanoculleus thermohydrogenotrophicum]HQC91992.1 YcaO-related McrA-glycine thioamidation protein [Can
MIRLQPCRKGYSKETQRAVPPEETLRRARARLPAAGITRVADITSLDRVGIPVFSSIRPTAATGAISVYNGKGATPIEAEVSAMMEGIERYSGEMNDQEPLVGRYSEVSASMTAINPADLVLPPRILVDVPVPWVAGYDIMQEEEVLVPAHAVYHPLPVTYGRLFRTNTNGLASGNTLEEAVFHALMEVVERDAWSLVEAARMNAPRIEGINDRFAADLLAKFEDAGIEVTLRDITSDIGVPTVAAVADDVVLKDPALLTIGMGSHTSAQIAVLRALTEVAQSRLTQIHGAREDTDTADVRRKIGYERTKRMNRHWFADGGDTVELAAIPSFDSDDFLTDINCVLDRLAAAGLSRVIVVDLTRPEIGIPVVRVVVPGLEVYAVDQDRFGRRCRDARNRRLPRSQL